MRFLNSDFYHQSVPTSLYAHEAFWLNISEIFMKFDQLVTYVGFTESLKLIFRTPLYIDIRIHIHQQ